jgi:hypothetical protein
MIEHQPTTPQRLAAGLWWFGFLFLVSLGVGAAIRPVQSPRAASQDSGSRVQVSGIKQSSLPPMPVATASAAKSSAAAIPVKPFLLTWDVEPGVTNWTVYSGTARNQWTATNTITTNVLEITDRTKAYGITAMFLGAPSVVAYWPSNRIERLVNEVYEYPGGPKVGEQVWMIYTNTLPGSARKFQRLRQELIGWQ